MIAEKIKTQTGFCKWCDCFYCNYKNPKSKCKRYKKLKQKMNRQIRMKIKQRKLEEE